MQGIAEFEAEIGPDFSGFRIKAAPEAHEPHPLHGASRRLHPFATAAARVPRLAREVERINTQEGTFAQRLRDLTEAKRISQQELADRVHCSQPVISQMLNRACRPQKKTILKLAEVLNVGPRDLWPDIEAAEALDAVASFQQPDYVMTPAEARALADTSKRNSPKIQAKRLPTRPRKKE